MGGDSGVAGATVQRISVRGSSRDRMREVEEGGRSAPVVGSTRWIVGDVISSLRGRRDFVGLGGAGEVYAVRLC